MMTPSNGQDVADDNSAEASADTRSKTGLANKHAVLIASWQPPHRFIENRYVSNFNAGSNIRLENFTRDEANKLIQLIRPALPTFEANTLYNLVGGHPFYLQLGLQWISDGKKIEDIVPNLFRGPYGFSLESIDNAIDNELKKKFSKGIKDLSREELDELYDISILTLLHDGTYKWSNHLYELAYSKNPSPA
jgi:hypothetical protein